VVRQATAAVPNGVITVGTQAYTVSAVPTESGVVVAEQTLTSWDVVVVSSVTLAPEGSSFVVRSDDGWWRDEGDFESRGACVYGGCL
jgi:hypothetical protein